MFRILLGSGLIGKVIIKGLSFFILLNILTQHVQVFFVEEKGMLGWCVVLKKEARGMKHNLG